MLVSAILSQLVTNDDYSRTVLPYLIPDYFQDEPERIVFETIKEYIHKYNSLPPISALQIDLEQNGKIKTQSMKTEVDRVVTSLDGEVLDLQWAIDQTEKFCQERAVENALYQSLGILEGKDPKQKLDKGAIPGLLSDALAVSFDNHIGHDYLEDWDTRYDYMHRAEARIPFDLEYMNKITGNGLLPGTLTVILGPPGGGKSLTMNHWAAANLILGKNVLYISLEMSEEQIAERIDANLLDTPIQNLKLLPRTSYERKVEKVRARTPGKLIVKDYPTGSAGADNFRHLLHELRLKKKFIPDIIYVDYLNICKSSRVRMAAGMNTYTYVKFIGEELRGLAVEHKLPVVTGSQLNRDGITSSDPSMEHTSDSLGTAMTADLIVAVFSNEELQKEGKMSIKQIKNRFNDPNYCNRFIVGCDRSRMRLYDAQDGDIAIQPDIPAFDNSTFGGRFDRKAAFEGFK